MDHINEIQARTSLFIDSDIVTSSTFNSRFLTQIINLDGFELLFGKIVSKHESTLIPFFVPAYKLLQINKSKEPDFSGWLEQQNLHSFHFPNHNQTSTESWIFN